MGFLSSIGSALGSVGGFLKDTVGGFVKDNVGSILGTAGDIVGGILGGNASEHNAQVDAAAALKAAELNLKYQKEFAQNGIRWRVDDAKKAGIHPLASLGAQITSFSPSFSMDAFAGDQRSTESPLALGLKSMGQNIDRAKLAKQEQAERDLDNAWKAAQIRRLEVDTALTQAQLSKVAVENQQLPAPMPKVNSKNPLDSQGFSDNAQDMFTVLINHRGERELYPTEAYYQIFEDKPFGVDLSPLLQAGGINLAARLGIIDKPVRANGRWYIFDSKANSWLPYTPSSGRGSISVIFPKKKPNYDRWANIH